MEHQPLSDKEREDALFNNYVLKLAAEGLAGRVKEKRIDYKDGIKIAEKIKGKEIDL